MSNPTDFLFQLDEYYLDLGDDCQLFCLDSAQLSARPFPGLRPFKASEFQLFHGRDGQAEELVKRLAQQHFLAVIGCSGSGKSSLIRAGLIPQLLAGYLQGAGTKWRIAICRPGKDPIENLAIALARLKAGTNEESKIRDEFDGIAPILENNIYGILEVNEILNTAITLTQSANADLTTTSLPTPAASTPPASNLLIIIDQFEELFRFDRADLGKPGIEKHFVDLLLKAASKPDQPIYVIITMRSEFLGDCSQFRGLPEAINAGQYLVPQIGREQITEVIRDPIKLAGKTIAQGFVELLVNETQQSKARYSQDQLPILQHALMRTYQASGKSPEVTYEFYKACGGMENALANHAETKYMELGDGGTEPSLKQQIAKLVFMALTDAGKDQKGGRRPTSLKIIYNIAGSLNAIPSQVNEVINTFRDADTSFILPPLNVDLNPELVLDISHESLMRQWTRLREWVDEESGYSQVMIRLVQDQQLYEKDLKELLRGKELYPIASWYHSFKPQPAWAERYTPDYAKSFDYLLKSERTEKRKHVLNRVALMLGVLLLLIGLIWVDKHQQHANQDKLAKKQDYISRGQSAIQYSDPLVGSLLLSEAINLGEEGDTLLQGSNQLLPTWYLNDVFKTIVEPDDVAFSDNGDSLLLWDKKNNVPICHVMSLSNDLFVNTIPNRPLILLPGQISDDISSGLRGLYSHWGIDPDGKAIIIDNFLTLSLTVPNNYHSMYDAVVNPDSTLIFTSGRNKTGNFVGNLYNLATGYQECTTMVHSDSIYRSVFNRENNKLMTWSLDRSIRIFIKISALNALESDLDFPVKLFKTQLEAVTGSRLNGTKNGFLPIEIPELKALTASWKEKAEAHYKVCKFKSANYWAHCFPEKAKLD